MLIEFTFSNYRSFRDENCLSMEAAGIKMHKNILIPFGSRAFLPSAVIYGKNGGGKSNIIRAFWLAVQFIRNAQRTQHENALVPVRPFLLDDYSRNNPTSFKFEFVVNGARYLYGFSATRAEITNEFLYHWPKGQKAAVFRRSGQKFSFPANGGKKRRTLISQVIAPNQLYFSVACTMNDSICIDAMHWFREQVYFSRDYTDIPTQLMENSDNPEILQSIKEYAKFADVGIQDLDFDFKSLDIESDEELPDELPDHLRNALSQFMKALNDPSNNAEARLRMGEVRVTSFHQGEKSSGESALFPLELADESDGTRRLMAISPAIEQVLSSGGVFAVDEIDKGFHPILVKALVSRFQNRKTNPKQAQLIFTTHNTDFLDLDLLRRDQFYFVDKNRSSGVSSLYSVSTQTNENMTKSYLAGKYGATPNIEIEEVE